MFFLGDGNKRGGEISPPMGSATGGLQHTEGREKKENDPKITRKKNTFFRPAFEGNHRYQETP